MNFIQQIDALDWTDFEKVSLQSQELLQHLAAHRRLLGQPQIWFQPTYSHRDKIDEYKNQGYRGCVGRNGQAVNDAYLDILPVCRLWKSDA